jgi:hypothetical protein
MEVERERNGLRDGGREREGNAVKMEVEREREEWCEDGGRERERGMV